MCVCVDLQTIYMVNERNHANQWPPIRPGPTQLTLSNLVVLGPQSSLTLPLHFTYPVPGFKFPSLNLLSGKLPYLETFLHVAHKYLFYFLSSLACTGSSWKSGQTNSRKIHSYIKHSYAYLMSFLVRVYLNP